MTRRRPGPHPLARCPPICPPLYWRLELGRFAEVAGDLLATGAAENDLPWLLQVRDQSLILVITPDAEARPEWAARLGL